MRILFTGGGTCGHIFPSIAIAEELKNENPNHEILFVGAKGKIEINLVRKAGFPIAEIWMDGFSRGKLFTNFLLPFKIIYSIWKSKKILKYFNPDIVVGTGGYVSYPILRVASKMKIPIILQEQNSTLGLTNRLFLKNAEKIFVSHKNLFEKINKKRPVAILSGNPLRQNIIKYRIGKNRALSSFGLDPNKKTILILGGSLGAKSINLAVAQNIKQFYQNDIQIIWQTGNFYFNFIKKRLPEQYLASVKLYPFINDLNYAYAASDIVIARSGALTISELSIKKKPVIFIPSPNVANDHQTKNVLELIEKKAAIVIKDKNIKELPSVALKLIDDKNLQNELSKNISEFAFPGATKIIAKKIISIPHDITGLSNKKLLQKYKYVYFIGIGGIGMSSLAIWFSKKGLKVFGYDKTPSKLTNSLKEDNISVGFEDNIRFIPRSILDNIRQTLVVYTPAIPDNNQILKFLREKEYAIFKRSTILAKITEEKFTIAIAGTHGKTTVSAMLSHILYESNQNMMGFVGGILKKYNSNLLLKSDDAPNSVAVVEADEFDRSFLKLKPNIALITSVDEDHLDIYKNQKDLKEAYIKFISLLPKNGKLIIEDHAFNELFGKNVTEIEKNKIIKYSINECKDVKAENIKIYPNYSQFDYVRPDLKIKDIKIPFQGYHNVENAIASITLGLLLGLSKEQIIKSLATFPGIERRFDYIIKSNKVVFINDYAHHPTEIAALLNSIKGIYPNKKISVIFQPHLFSRTKQFSKEFAAELSKADEIFLLPIYPAREEPIRNVTSKLILSKIKNKSKQICEKEELLEILKNSKIEVLLTVGAGDILDLVPQIEKILIDKYELKQKK